MKDANEAGANSATRRPVSPRRHNASRLIPLLLPSFGRFGYPFPFSGILVALGLPTLVMLRHRPNRKENAAQLGKSQL